MMFYDFFVEPLHAQNNHASAASQVMNCIALAVNGANSPEK